MTSKSAMSMNELTRLNFQPLPTPQVLGLAQPAACARGGTPGSLTPGEPGKESEESGG